MAHIEKRKLGLVQTGGTIASVKGPLGTDLALEDVILKLLGDEAESYEIIPRRPYHILSENANTHNWQLAAQAVAELINEGVDGVVVTHGTDTMTYSAAALSFMLRPLTVPVILTGSMLSSDDHETDGRPNLIWSIRAALNPDTPREVSVMFGGGATAVTAYYAGTDNFRDVYHTSRLEQILIRGNRVKKVSAWPEYFKPVLKRYAAFQSIHTDILGAVPAGGKELIFNPTVVISPAAAGSTPLAKLIPQTALNRQVIPLRVHPGIDPQLLVKLAEEHNYRGIILEAYGDGTMPSGPDYSLHPAIEQATRAGACVCVTSSVLGPATTDVYAGSRDLANAGAVPLLDMTTECAVVKLMWALGNHPDTVRSVMRQNLVGEITNGQ